MGASLSRFRVPPRKTTILDLNDDCLMEVFAHMDPETLTTVADVCTRFKQNTMHAARRKIKKIRFCKEFNLREELSVYKFSMLRNFGEFIEKIHLFREWGKYIDAMYNDAWPRDNVEKRIYQYLSLYCVGKSIKLRCSELRITDEIAVLMRPLLARVQKLRFEYCRLGEVFLRDSPFWSAALQESENGAVEPVNENKNQFGHLHQKNLKSICFLHAPDVENVHIEKLVQQNPQLKEIGLFRCGNLDSCVLESIARNVSAIEKIGFVLSDRKKSNREHIKYFRQLHQLKSLTLGVYDDDSCVQLVVHEIARLECLDLSYFDLRHNANQFTGGISRLQQLKTLRLDFIWNLTAAHLIEICKHAKELSDIYLREVAERITTTDLLEIVKNARKLQKFVWSVTSSIGKLSIIDGTFPELAKLVDQRSFVHFNISSESMFHGAQFQNKIVLMK